MLIGVQDYLNKKVYKVVASFLDRTIKADLDHFLDVTLAAEPNLIAE